MDLFSNKNLGMVSATLLLGAFQVGCGGSGAKGPGQPSTPVVICVAAVTQQVTDFDEFVGRTEPSESVDVQSRVNGFLQTVEFADGQLVEEGDLLATIEPDEYEAIHKQSLATIDLWESKLALAETTFERYKELLSNNAVSQAEYDESEAAVMEARSQIKAAEAAAARTALDVEYTKVLAPISGRTDRAFVTHGNLLTGGLGAGTLLTRIVNDTPMFAYIDVDERSVLEYKRRAREEGTSSSADGALKNLKIPCFLKLQDESEFLHEGYLDFAENRVDPDTGTIKIRAVYENADHFLQGGLFVRVQIPKGEPYTGTLIPEQCIAADLADRVAYVVNDKNEVETRVLELGSRFGNMRSIRKGIREGERVIYQGIQKVRPGMTVQPELTTLESTAQGAGENGAGEDGAGEDGAGEDGAEHQPDPDGSSATSESKSSNEAQAEIDIQ